jgi:spoIIIJ-associated protein
MAQVERSGGTVEEAVESALADLGISEQEAHIEILQEPKSGFLGFNAQAALVRVTALAAAGHDDLEKQGDAAADFVDGLLEVMGIDADVDLDAGEHGTYVEVWGGESPEDAGLLIGKHGRTLEAVQELVRSVVQRQTGARCQVIVDVEDYRKRRSSRVVGRAKEAARRVRTSGRPEALEPMSAFERKIVHDTVAEFGDLVTGSEGDEPKRYVVIRRREG